MSGCIPLAEASDLDVLDQSKLAYFVFVLCGGLVHVHDGRGIARETVSINNNRGALFYKVFLMVGAQIKTHLGEFYVHFGAQARSRVLN
jgi:hypothetical protein